MPPIMTTAARIPAKAITLTRGVSVRSIAIPIGTRGVPLYGETREGAVARALSVKLAAGLGYAQLPALYEPVAVTPIAFAGPCLKAVQPPTSTATQ